MLIDCTLCNKNAYDPSIGIVQIIYTSSHARLLLGGVHSGSLVVFNNRFQFDLMKDVGLFVSVKFEKQEWK